MNTHELKTRSQNISNIIDEYKGELVNDLVDYLVEHNPIKLNIQDHEVTWTDIELKGSQIIFHFTYSVPINGVVEIDYGEIELDEMSLDTFLYIMNNI